MNRLVIIGNGFDLANGLPTSYGHFIDDFWKCFKDKVRTDEYQKFIYANESYDKYYSNYVEINNFKDFICSITEFTKNRTGIYYDPHKIKLENHHSNDREIFHFKNDFFKIINRKNLENWVDIENVYYGILKEKATPKIGSSLYPQSIEILNEEFQELKNLLEKYLIEKVLNEYDLDFTKNQNIDWNKFYNFLKPISVHNNEQNILKEFLIKEDNSEIKNLFLREKREELVNKIYFLNFNYTPTLNTYCKKLNEDDRIECSINFIHGALENNNENKINLGFGDEMDDDYKAIENINENVYLKYFKSFQYLQNSNYSNLLSYIDSEKYQVIVMGHSCGLSDRTLLNTIFEHNNCRSIKVFYHQKKDGTDNYTEIIQNISRHFNKKALMRSKIVNKTLCQPLPQIQLPKKD